MPNSAILKVSCARASDRPSATFTAGMTGKNRWTASGVISAVMPSAITKARPGFGCVDSIRTDTLRELREQAERVAPVDGRALLRRDGVERLIGLHCSVDH